MPFRRLSLIFLIMLAVSTCFSIRTFTARADNAEEVRIIDFSGEVEITDPETGQKTECCEGARLKEGTLVTTGPGSFVDVGFGPDLSKITRIKENSEVVLKLEREEKVRLIDGRAYFLIKKLKREKSFEVRVPGAVCGARGTGWVNTVDGDLTSVEVFQGEVYVLPEMAGFGKYDLGRGDILFLDRRADAIEKRKIPEERLMRLEEEFRMYLYDNPLLERKMRLFRNGEEMREKQIESLERKEEKRPLPSKDRSQRTSGSRAITVKP